jgi:hypothetical protein
MNKRAQTTSAGGMRKAPETGQALTTFPDLPEKFWLRDTLTRLQLPISNSRNISDRCCI